MNKKVFEIVSKYVEEHLDKSDPKQEFEVFVVQHCRILGNEKWLLSTTLPYSDFYEVIYNKDKKEFYLGTYKKVQNCCIENFNHISPLTNCRLRDKGKKKMSKKKVQNNNNTPLQKKYQHLGREIPNNGSHVVFAIREGKILMGKYQDGKFIDSNNKLNVLSPEEVISYFYLKDLFKGAL